MTIQVAEKLQFKIRGKYGFFRYRHEKKKHQTDLFRKHNYGLQTTIGTVEHLKNPSLEAIRNYYNEYYVPNNMAIIMSGDFDPDAVAAEPLAKAAKPVAVA